MTTMQPETPIMNAADHDENEQEIPSLMLPDDGTTIDDYPDRSSPVKSLAPTDFMLTSSITRIISIQARHSSYQ
jgi:hypothetical protein